MSSTTSTIRVFATVAEEARKRALPSKPKPSHWNNDAGTGFHNPWPSAGSGSLNVKDFVNFMVYDRSKLSPLSTAAKPLPIIKPTWRVPLQPDSTIHATWLGHACYFIEMPITSPNAQRGARILFDPVFSDRCAPTQFIGPKRFSPPPCQIDEIPDVEAIIISHNHYDHLDLTTLTTLFSRSHKPQLFIPLGNEGSISSLSSVIPQSNIHTMDWWDSLRFQSESYEMDITCTPAQHQSGRGLFDQKRGLWASWVLSTPDKERKVFFTGDTGYRALKADSKPDDEEAPFCPVFKEIGDVFGGMDLALIPIGAYAPQQLFSAVHVNPSQSVNIFKDIKAKKALAMHWGTWVLTPEPVTEPPILLSLECKKQGLEDGQFDICGLGETRSF